MSSGKLLIVGGGKCLCMDIEISSNLSYVPGTTDQHSLSEI